MKGQRRIGTFIIAGIFTIGMSLKEQ